MPNRNDPNQFENRPDYTKAAMPDFTPATKKGSAPKLAVDTSYNKDQSKKGSVMFGRSSSFKTSSGLINALDVVKGVTDISGKAVQAQNTLDKNKSTRMTQELAARKQQDDWLDMSPEDQFAATRQIQDKYESGWHTARGRAAYDNARTGLDFEAKKHDLEAGLAAIGRDELDARHRGQEGMEVWNTVEPRYEALLAEHGNDPLVAARIQMARDQTRYAADADRQKTMANTFNVTANNGTIDRMALEMDPALGYDEWQKAVMSEAIAQGGEAMELALGGEYDQDSDTWSGDYSGSLLSRIEPVLRKTYEGAVKVKTQEAQGNLAIQAGSLIEANTTVGHTADFLQEDAVSGVAHGQTIDRMIGVFSLRGQQLTTTDKRRESILKDVGGTVIGMIKNSGDPEKHQANILSSWEEILDNPTLRDSMYAAVGISDDDVEGKKELMNQVKTRIRSQAKKYMDDRARGSKRENSNNSTSIGAGRPSPATDAKALNDRVDKSWATRVRNGAITLYGGPVGEEDVAANIANTLTFAEQLSQGRAFSDPNFSGEQAAELRAQIRGLAMPSDAVPADAAWARKTNKDIITAVQAAGLLGEDSPYTLTETSSGDWTLTAKDSYSSRDAQIGVAMSYMAVESDGKGGFVYNLDGGAAAFAKLGELMGHGWDGLIANGETEPMVEKFLEDSARMQSGFGNKGVNFYAGQVLKTVLGEGYISADEESMSMMRKGLTRTMEAIHANGGVATPAQIRDLNDKFIQLKTRRNFKVETNKNTRTGTQLVLGKEGLGFEALLGSASMSDTERESGFFDTLEYGFQAFGGGYIPGDNSDADSYGASILRDSASVALLTAAIVDQVEAGQSKMFVKNELKGTIEWSPVDMTRSEQAAELRKAMDKANLEMIPQYIDEEGNPQGHMLRERKSDLHRNADGNLVPTGSSISVSGDLNDVMKKFDAHDEANGKSPVDFLVYNLQNMSFGTFGPETVKRLESPEMRRSVIHWGSSAQTAITNPQTRGDLADRIEAQIAYVNDSYPDVPMSEDLGELIAELRGPHKEGRSGSPYATAQPGNPAVEQFMGRAREIAKEQGVRVEDGGEVANFFLLAAIGEEIFDIPQWQHAPMSMVPTEVPSVGDVAVGSDLGLYN